MAYLRFASVYRSFASIEDFEAEIRALRQAAAPAPRGEPRELEPAP